MVFEPIEPKRNKRDILSNLKACKLFHFAGHGLSDSVDPLRSCLLLEDWKYNPLTVKDLLEIKLYEHAPFFAFLSACATGRNKVERYIDESVHLISACQIAGYRHVVGTLWEVDDESCVDMARITYEGMRDGAMTDRSVCFGLHQASRELRDRHWESRTRRSVLVAGEASQIQTEADDVTGCVLKAHQATGKYLREGELCDDDDGDHEDDAFGASHSYLGTMHWVPYVHFGV